MVAGNVRIRPHLLALAAALALAALALALPGRALALSGAGTEDDPVVVSSADDLVAWAVDLNQRGVDFERDQHVKLGANLEVDDAVLDAMDHPYLQVASFDGDGYIITLDLTRHGGLFQDGNLDWVTEVRDVNTAGSVNVPSLEFAGSLFSHVEKSEKLVIYNCANWAAVTAQRYAGGIVGGVTPQDSSRDCEIKNTVNYGSVSTSEGDDGGGAGGLVGFVGGVSDGLSVELCSNNGLVTGHAASAGGLIGLFTRFVAPRYCFNMGAVSSDAAAGGIVGCLSGGEGASLKSCYNRGSIAGGSWGGLVGKLENGSSATVNRCLSVKESLPDGAQSDETYNGMVLEDQKFIGTTEWAKWLNQENTYQYYSVVPGENASYPLLEGVGIGRMVTCTYSDRMGGERTSYQNRWGTYSPHDTPSSSPEKMRFAYWTREPPDENNVYAEPPEFPGAQPTPYGLVLRDADFYAYYEQGWLTLSFDLNAPEGATCTMEPEAPATKIIEGSSLNVGDLPKPQCVVGDYQFAGWCTGPRIEDGFWVEPYGFVNEAGTKQRNDMTLYAIWHPKGPVLSVDEQPVDTTVTAAKDANVPDRRAEFSCSVKVPYGATYEMQWQRYRTTIRDGKLDLVTEDIDGANDSRCYLEVDELDDADYGYRCKITRHAYTDKVYGYVPETVTYSNSARIKVEVPSLEDAELVSLKLSDDQRGHSLFPGEGMYDVALSITDDAGELLGDEYSLETHKSGPCYEVWIRDQPNSVETYYTTTPTAQLRLQEGRTYDLLVRRVLNDSQYRGEGLWRYVTITVPYKGIDPIRVSDVMITDDLPLDQNGEVLPIEEVENVRVGDTFYLVVDSKWEAPLPEGRTLDVRWQCDFDEHGRPRYSGFADVPETFSYAYYKDEPKGRPYQTWWQDDDGAWWCRAYTPFTAYAELVFARFSGIMTTQPASTETPISWGFGNLYATLTAPQNVQVSVDEETLMATVTWDWPEAGNDAIADGSFSVVAKSIDGRTSSTYLQNGEHKAELRLDSQTEYEVTVTATRFEAKERVSEPVYVTTPGETNVEIKPSVITPAAGENTILTADLDWADYQDGKHQVRYKWYMSSDEKGSYASMGLADEGFNHSQIRFPDDFPEQRSMAGGKIMKREETLFVQVEAEVFEFDPVTGITGDGVPGTQVLSRPVPVCWDHEAPRDLTGEPGTHSVNLSWKASPVVSNDLLYRVVYRSVDEGDDGEYDEGEVMVPGDRVTKNPTYTLKGLKASTAYFIKVSVADSRCPNVRYAMSHIEVETLAEPQAGLWTAQAPSVAAVGDPDKPLVLAVDDADPEGDPVGTLAYAWQKWDAAAAAWVAAGEASASAEYRRPVLASDIGGLWRCVVTASTIDGLSAQVFSTTVSPKVQPALPSGLALDGVARADALPLRWNASDGADGYVLKYTAQDPARTLTQFLREGDYTVEEGVVRYTLDKLDPDTTYRLELGATALSERTPLSEPVDIATGSESAVKPPVFDEKPYLALTTLGGMAEFSVRAHDPVDADAPISFRWERMGLGESAFVPVDPALYAVQDDADGKGSKLVVGAVGRADVGAAFRCVAVREAGGERAEAASSQARLLVRAIAPDDVRVEEAGRTSARVTWTPREGVSRYLLRLVLKGPDGETTVRRMLVQLSDEEMAAGRASRQLTELRPATSYAVTMTASPPGDFDSAPSEASVFATQPEEGGVYQVIEGAGGTWEPGGDAGLTFKIDAPLESFVSAAVDGVDLGEGDFDVVSGSTVVTLRPAFLEGLAAGAHTLTATFVDGTATATFTVDKPVDTPDGDTPGGDVPGGDVPGENGSGGDAGSGSGSGTGGSAVALAPTGDPLAAVPATVGALAAAAGLALAANARLRRSGH